MANYLLTVRNRTRPELPGLTVTVTLEEAVRVIEDLEVIPEFFFELRTASIALPLAA